MVKIYETDRLDWTGGRTWYVPLGASIATAITNATAGDTIQLGSGTYTITSALTVNKKLHIKGMGRGLTTIASATNANMINFTTQDGSKISDLTMSFSASITAGTAVLSFVKSGTVQDVNYIGTVTGTSSGNEHLVQLNDANSIVNCYNINFNSSGATHLGAIVITLAGIVNVWNSNAIVTNKTGNVGETLLWNIGGTTNLYNCNFDATASSSNGSRGAIFVENGAVNVYNSTIKATGTNTLELRRDAGTLTVYDCTLVNNTTSGTITYAGTKRFNNVTANGNYLGVGKIETTSTASDSIKTAGQVLSAGFRLSALQTAPANAEDTGTLGEIRIVDGYIYVCTATNTWKRAEIATW